MVESLQKQENTCITNDRLSELPEELLIHILSFLPTRDAVRTLLFRRFGDLWTLLPTLIFKGDSPKFITSVMKYHKSHTIDRCELSWDCDEYIQEYMTNWLHVALKKNLKVLDIKSEYSFNGGLDLSPMFTSKSILTLKLSYWSMNLPCRVNMASLKTLELCLVDMDDDNIKVLEVGCPCLQELSLYYPSRLEKCHFTAPNIETLKLYLCCWRNDKLYSLYCPKLKFLDIEVNLDKLELIDVSCVTHAKIKHYSSIKIHNFELLYKKFQNAKVFHLEDNGGFVIFLGVKVCMQLERCRNEKLAFQHNDLSPLVLKSGFQRSCLLGICRLLKYTMYLEELIIYVDVDVFCDCSMLLQELSSPCEMYYLKSVTIHEYEKPCRTLVQLVEFLLKNADVLEKLVIVCNNKDELYSTKGLEFTLELLSLPRASHNARVVIA